MLKQRKLFFFTFSLPKHFFRFFIKVSTFQQNTPDLLYTASNVTVTLNSWKNLILPAVFLHRHRYNLCNSDFIRAYISVVYWQLFQIWGSHNYFFWKTDINFVLVTLQKAAFFSKLQKTSPRDIRFNTVLGYMTHYKLHNHQFTPQIQDYSINDFHPLRTPKTASHVRGAGGEGFCKFTSNIFISENNYLRLL